MSDIRLDDARATYGSSLAFVSHRDEIPFLLNARGLLGCGAEVGVQEGIFSAQILTHWAGLHLLSIDPWRVAPADEYVDMANVSQGAHDLKLDETMRRLAPFGDRSSIWRATSIEAAGKIPRHSLDFVYIDARHDVASVLEDLAAWAPRIRPGGLVMGHDYVDGSFPAGEFGVKSAVDAFFAAQGLPVYATHHDGPFTSWLVEVPGARTVGAGFGPGLPANERSAVGQADGAQHSASLALAPTTPPVGSKAAQALAAGLQARAFAFTRRDGARQMVHLELDPAQMSQRYMIDAIDQGMPYELETFRAFCALIEPGDLVIDVGAHVGYFTVLAARLVGPDGHVLAFEPNPDNAARVRRHADLNELWQVAVVDAAVADRDGSASLHLNADNDGGHALWDVGQHPFNTQSRQRPRTLTVPVVRLDSALERLGAGPVRLLKVDAEGAEVAVLEGARGRLAADRIPYVICEVNETALGAMGTSTEALRRLMEELGYECYAMEPNTTRVLRVHSGEVVRAGNAVYNLLFRRPEAPFPLAE